MIYKSVTKKSTIGLKFSLYRVFEHEFRQSGPISETGFKMRNLQRDSGRRGLDPRDPGHFAKILGIFKSPESGFFSVGWTISIKRHPDERLRLADFNPMLPNSRNFSGRVTLRH